MAKSDAEPTLLQEIRDNWRIDDLEWTDIRDEGDKDIHCLTGGLWNAMDPEGTKQRKDANRPMIELDELNQYCNQVINDLRANKRGITVAPKGNGANDKTALFRQGKIRDTEYRSNSHQAYTTLAENMIQRSYGWLEVTSEHVTDTAEDFSIFDQELIIKPVVNPNMITPGAHSVSSDGKDLTRLWVRESRGIEEFKREFKGAKIRGFTPEEARLAPQWIKGNSIDVAKYWTKRPNGKKTRIALKPTDGGEPLLLWKDEAKKLFKGEIPSDLVLKSREIEYFKVCNYLTNGFEILETNEWPGQSIPFVSGYGKVVYVTEGGQTKRKMLSLVRLARSPQMLMAYLASCEAEEVGQILKFPYFYRAGSLSKDAIEKLTKANHEPVGPIPVNATAPGMVGTPEFPVRNQLTLQVHELEILKESVRRSIQAAIGASPLPTQAQRHNEKSGVALKQIEDTAQKGSFHFVDHYDEAIARTGTILNEVLPAFYDTARSTSIRDKTDKPVMVRINDPRQADEQGQPMPHAASNQEAGFEPHIDASAGDHDVTISVGPRQDSEREASSDFADTLIGSKAMEFVAPPQRAKLLAATVKLKNLGPVGDEIAEILDPQDKNDPAMAAHQLEGAKHQMQEMGQAIQQLTMEKHAKVLDLQSREKIAQMEIQSKEAIAAADRETKITVAELGAKVDRMQLFLDERERIGLQGVDAAKTAAEHNQEVKMAVLDHQQGLEAAQVGHQQALEQGQAGVAGQMATQQQAADLAPQPETGA